jgi:hypothetical protein
MLKAIETVYKGYRFRSRLEARWAVFFDAAGIDYQYEPEGFELSCGRYLPDFYIPKWDCYIEVKGQPPTKIEIEKAGELASGSGKNVYIIGNQLDEWNDTHVLEPYRTDGLEGLPGCYSHNTISNLYECLTHKQVLGFYPSQNCNGEGAIHGYCLRGPILNKAYNAAKQARFEHGETPLVRY